jgi:hypothetical protein
MDEVHSRVESSQGRNYSSHNRRKTVQQDRVESPKELLEDPSQLDWLVNQIRELVTVTSHRPRPQPARPAGE